MSNAKIREQICVLAKSMFDRGLTAGASGNISVRLEDNNLLVTPTGACFGRLDPGQLSHISDTGALLSGDAPTKEMSLHSAFYESRQNTGAVVHLHSSHSVALSMVTPQDGTPFLPPLTAYSVMRLGRVELLPYFRPGDPAMGDAVRSLAGKRSAVMLASHGPVVAGLELEAAVFAIEELEETAKLCLLLKGMKPTIMDDTQIKDLATHFKIEWD